MFIEEFEHDETNERMWAKLGRFFASAAVKRELGGYMVSDRRYTWWVAFDDDHETVMGFVAARKHTDHAYLTYAYTLPEYRNQGVYAALFEARLKGALEWDIQYIKTAVNGNSEHMYVERGFEFVSESKDGYRTLVKHLC